MQSNTPVFPAIQEEMDTSARVSVVLLQHWATMVDEQRHQLDTAARQIVSLDERASRLYRDVIAVHGLFNESEAELSQHIRINRLLTGLLTRIIAENPELPQNYNDEMTDILIGTFENPIDLTADEDIDEVEL